MYITNKKGIICIVLMSLFLLCANGKEVMLSPDEFKTDVETIILETLFGTDSDEHIEYLCIAKKEGHYNIWYFSEINGEVHCLACAKRDSDLTKVVFFGRRRLNKKNTNGRYFL